MIKICSVLGTPTAKEWPDAVRLAERRNFKFPHLEKKRLSSLMPNAGREAIDLMEQLFRFDYKKRPNTDQVMNHAYFIDFLPPEDITKALAILSG